MRPNSPPEMEKLLTKYGHGSVPSLIAEDDENEHGLLNEELLDIFQKGFSATYGIPLCISIVSGNNLNREHQTDREEKLSGHESDHSHLSCGYIQSILENNEEKYIRQGVGLVCCERSSIDPVLVTQIRKAGIYMCRLGMVSPAVPVCVADEVIAILSSKCKKPAAGAIWPEQLARQNIHNSPFIDGSSEAAKIDLWQKSERRIQEFEEKLDLDQDELLETITESVRINPKNEAFPEDFDSVLNAIKNAGAHLAEMADKTYRLEKDSVMGWLRAEMASALSSVDTFWEKIQQCFRDLARLVGVDYILLISRDRSHASPLNLQCQYGLPEESLSVVEYDWMGSTTRVDDFIEKISIFEHGAEIDLRQYRDVPILGMLYSLYGKGISYPVFIAPTTTLNGGLTLMVLGRMEPTSGRRPVAQNRYDGNNVNSIAPTMGWPREDDRQYLMTIVREMAIITSVYSSMKRFEETMEEQTNLMESVAHDLRTPVQNIMIAAENLREGRVDPERASRTITGVVTQLQRLNLLAQKAWMLERIRLDKMVYNDKQVVEPFSIFTECRELLIDMAERASIEIIIDPGLKHWQAIHLDKEMFRLVVLNLLHNGIKYSFPNTCVKIGGWQNDGRAGTSITFENKGIHIHEEEKDRIFERYFRAKDAIIMDPAGSGVGLALVKEFVDHYGGRIDVISNEIGFGKYINMFSIFLPGR